MSKYIKCNQHICPIYENLLPISLQACIHWGALCRLYAPMAFSLRKIVEKVCDIRTSYEYYKSYWSYDDVTTHVFSLTGMLRNPFGC